MRKSRQNIYLRAHIHNTTPSSGTVGHHGEENSSASASAAAAAAAGTLW